MVRGPTLPPSLKGVYIAAADALDSGERRDAINDAVVELLHAGGGFIFRRKLHFGDQDVRAVEADVGSHHPDEAVGEQGAAYYDDDGQRHFRGDQNFAETPAAEARPIRARQRP